MVPVALVTVGSSDDDLHWELAGFGAEVER